MIDNIIAVSTLVGESAINIIRLSGDDVIKIVNKYFSRDLEKFESNTINYGKFIYENEIIDEVLVSIFKAPKSYTTENIVEINCHGGVTATNKIMEILLLDDVRQAEPGEFIKRAFLNGRIDLVEAEAVGDLISSSTESARKLSINGINGEISKLKEDSIDLESGMIYIIGKGDKERNIQIVDEDVLNLLKEYIALRDKKRSDSNYFFKNERGTRYTEQSIRIMIKKYTREAGINMKITPHMFRHSFATYLIEEGVDISCLRTLLGHSSIKTTQIYVYVAVKMQAEILKRKHPRNKMNIMTR